MHFIIDVCRCCLKCDTSLSNWPIVNGNNGEHPNKYVQQIQTIYPDLQLNYTLPFQLCNDCQRLVYKAFQIKQYLDYQERNEQSQKILLKENTCSSCLEICTTLSSQILDSNVLDIHNKNCIEIIRDILPHYNIDPNVPYKYCHSCSSSIKSLYILGASLANSNTLYEKYCYLLLNNSKSNAPTFSQLSIHLQKTPNLQFDTDHEGISIKEETESENYTINIKIECDENNYKHVTDSPPNHELCEGGLIQERKLKQEDNYSRENNDFQSSSTSNNSLGKRYKTFLNDGQERIWIEKEPFWLNIRSTKSQHANTHIENNQNSLTKNRYKCNYCLKTFHYKSTFLRHERIHTGEKPYKCKHCLKSFIDSSDLKKHERIHISKPYTCKFCSKGFSRNEALKKHEMRHIGTKCNYCSKSFSHKSHLLEHERSHTGERPYNCNYCSKSFTTAHSFRTHEKIHTNTKPHTCNYCSKSFITGSHLKIHERVHTGEKPFKCNLCSKSFRLKYSLKCHESSHSNFNEGNAGIVDKPHKCNYCLKSFSFNSKLRVHERIHTGEKPYKCNFCSKSFNSTKGLKTHELIHSEEKPYKCNSCSKAFKIKSTLVVHERIHSGFKPYKCNFCLKSFNQSSILKRHERVHTRARN